MTLDEPPAELDSAVGVAGCSVIVDVTVVETSEPSLVDTVVNVVTVSTGAPVPLEDDPRSVKLFEEFAVSSLPDLVALFDALDFETHSVHTVTLEVSVIDVVEPSFPVTVDTDVTMDGLEYSEDDEKSSKEVMSDKDPSDDADEEKLHVRDDV